MDSAWTPNTIKTVLNTQAYRLKHHDAQLSNIAAGVKQLTDSQADLQVSVATKVNQLTDQMQSLTSRLEDFIIASPSPPAASGSTSQLHRLLLLLRLKAPPAASISAASAPSSLPVSSAPVPVLASPSEVFRRVRRLAPRTGSVFCSAQDPTQGRRRVVDYALEFRTLAADSGWNETSIIGAFMDGLAEEVKDFLAPLDTPRDFESLVEIASRIDNRLRERERETSAGSQVFGVPGGAALLP
ncbi:hypothetical protein L3Q82_006021 [Scortum barcoo]|uniref:Uncharacterized protein n=1 Tax=Scortum barcoo TaxID=214431 RepID=A0ACB8X2Q2_9TELE|nr:hypothetical protein L3Q82_006021 [Scortum barcoo]